MTTRYGGACPCGNGPVGHQPCSLGSSTPVNPTMFVQVVGPTKWLPYTLDEIAAVLPMVEYTRFVATVDSLKSELAEANRKVKELEEKVHDYATKWICQTTTGFHHQYCHVETCRPR